jgi:hypothetical protein
MVADADAQPRMTLEAAFLTIVRAGLMLAT